MPAACENEVRFYFILSCYPQAVRSRASPRSNEERGLTCHASSLLDYLMESSPRGAQVYYALTSLVNELISPLIVSPQPHQINVSPTFSSFLPIFLLISPCTPVGFHSCSLSSDTLQASSICPNVQQWDHEPSCSRTSLQTQQLQLVNPLRFNDPYSSRHSSLRLSKYIL